MKSHERFVDSILRAVHAGQGKGPAATTALIQEALQAAGLMGGTPVAPAAAEAPPATGFVDLNAAPDWLRKAAGLARVARTGGGSAAGTRDGTSEGTRAGTAALGPGAFLHGSYANAAGSRRYRLYVPARAASGPRPLVVMLHGCTQNPEDFAAGTTMNLLAEEKDCLVLYPEQPASANHSQCWNWFDAAHQGRAGGETSLLAGMVREVVREHGADPARVYVAGLSAGGAMAAQLGASHPELFAAVGVHSGLPAGSARDLVTGLQAMKRVRKHAPLERPVPAIVFHGDADAVVHPSNGEAVYRQFGAHGAALSEVEEGGAGHTKTTMLGAGGKAVAEHWLLHGAGHAWSGGSTAGSYAVASGPSASSEMLRFFLSQRLD